MIKLRYLIRLRLATCIICTRTTPETHKLSRRLKENKHDDNIM